MTQKIYADNEALDVGGDDYPEKCTIKFRMVGEGAMSVSIDAAAVCSR